MKKKKERTWRGHLTEWVYKLLPKRLANVVSGLTMSKESKDDLKKLGQIFKEKFALYNKLLAECPTLAAWNTEERLKYVPGGKMGVASAYQSWTDFMLPRNMDQFYKDWITSDTKHESIIMFFMLLPRSIMEWGFIKNDENDVPKPNIENEQEAENLANRVVTELSLWMHKSGIWSSIDYETLREKLYVYFEGEE